MKDTQDKITELMVKLRMWGVLDTLTNSEKDNIKSDLEFIAFTAVNDCRNSINSLLLENLNIVKK